MAGQKVLRCNEPRRIHRIPPVKEHPMRKTIIGGLAVVLTLPVQAQDAPWLGEARQVASSVPPKLLQVLQTEIARGGPASAVEVCRDQAPQMAKAASEQTGWAIRRVSLRNRNPKAVPDAWERAALEDFDRRAAAGENPATLEKWEVVGSERRYMKALPVQNLCVDCHGPVGQLAPGVQQRLQALYPQDLGTGYAVGQIRGAITVRRPQ
jgi:hypothetical protein